MSTAFERIQAGLEDAITYARGDTLSPSGTCVVGGPTVAVGEAGAWPHPQRPERKESRRIPHAPCGTQSVWGPGRYPIDVPTVNVRAIRRRMGLTQEQFSAKYGFTLAAVRNWEQGRRRPERAARLLLKVIEMHPEVVEDALAEGSREE